MHIETVAAADVQQSLPDLLNQIEAHELDWVAITRHSKLIALLVASDESASVSRNGYGCMAGTVTISEGMDLTDTIGDLSEFDAFHGNCITDCDVRFVHVW